MGLLNKKNDQGNRDKEFETLISEFKEKATAMVAQDEKCRKAVILIAVEESKDGSGAHVDVSVSGTEDKLVYALYNFANKPYTSDIFHKTVKFLNYLSLSNIIGKL